MQQTINQSVQGNLNKLERDCKLVSATIEDLLAKDKKQAAKNFKASTSPRPPLDLP
jgi:hypothetical protein